MSRIRPGRGPSTAAPILPADLWELKTSTLDAIPSSAVVRYGISVDEWRILRALAGAGTVTTSEIAHASGLEKSRLCRMLWRLEEAGHVWRQYDANDRRVKVVALSDRGATLTRTIAASFSIQPEGVPGTVASL